MIDESIGALAHLGLARAYAVQGDTLKARAAYQDFLRLWKDADPDIPILIAAKSEYAKAQCCRKRIIGSTRIEPRKISGNGMAFFC